MANERSAEMVGLAAMLPTLLSLLLVVLDVVAVLGVHGIGTRPGEGGLVASVIRAGPSAIAPNPVAVALNSGR